MYFIVWKYSVPESHQMIFENEYGNKGVWAKLFKKSSQYLRSDLIKINSDFTTYFLIDIWKSEKSYHEFLKKHNQEYSDISSKNETLYSSEIKLGEFDCR